MAVKQPTGDNARKGAVKKRSQLKAKVMGEDTWTKRNKASVHAGEKAFKGGWKEKSR